MVPANAKTSDPAVADTPVKSPPQPLPQSHQPDDATAPNSADPDQIEDIFKDLKTLLSTVEKLQKAREEVGDIKPLIGRLLDGELLSGPELDQLKAGIGGLSKLVRLYSDYQISLEKAQPARALLDQVIK